MLMLWMYDENEETENNDCCDAGDDVVKDNDYEDGHHKFSKDFLLNSGPRYKMIWSYHGSRYNNSCQSVVE